jgi:hypothetical protein
MEGLEVILAMLVVKLVKKEANDPPVSAVTSAPGE